MKKIVCLTLIAFLSLSMNAQRRKVKKKKPTPEELAEQAREEKLQLARLSTAQITFVDSVVVSADELFLHLNQAAQETGTVSADGFVSQIGNRHILSQRAADGRMQRMDNGDATQGFTRQRSSTAFPIYALRWHHTLLCRRK